MIAVIVCFFISIILVVYVTTKGSDGFEISQLKLLNDEKERLLGVLKEVELDFSLNNINEKDYDESSKLYQKELDQIEAEIQKVQ